MNPINSNPNDFKVVSFHNNTDFNFTAEMGCMYDSRPINGKSGLGIEAGEVMILPYHIGNQLAINLAKIVLLKSQTSVDNEKIPTGVPLWSETSLEQVKNKFLTDQYSESKPTAVSETDKLMAKVEEYRKMVESLISSKEVTENGNFDTEVKNESISDVSKVFLDKQEVIAELEKRGIKHDKRLSKDILEKLIV